MDPLGPRLSGVLEQTPNRKRASEQIENVEVRAVDDSYQESDAKGLCVDLILERPP
jgi:hypothetical protein